MTTVEVSAVPLEALDVVWEDCARLLEPAIARSGGQYTREIVQDLLARRELAMWVATDAESPMAAWTSRIVAYPNSRALVIDLLGGTRMDEWLSLLMRVMQRYARDTGCSHMEAFGRDGWERVLKSHGWKPAYVAYKMELTNEGWK